MAADSLTATIEIETDSGKEGWQFELSLSAPLSPEELKAALVAEFASDPSDVDQFDLEYAGTVGSPKFKLSKNTNTISGKKRIN